MEREKMIQEKAKEESDMDKQIDRIMGRYYDRFQEEIEAKSFFDKCVNVIEENVTKSISDGISEVKDGIMNIGKK